MSRRTLAVLVLALAIPAVALAAKPQHPKPKPPNGNGKAAPTVMYVLKGMLSNYTAASSTANGSISIHVLHSNHHARALVSMDLTFAVSATTRTTLKKGATTIPNGARGMVKFRAHKNMSTSDLLAAVSPNKMTALQVIEKGLPRQFMLIPPRA